MKTDRLLVFALCVSLVALVSISHQSLGQDNELAMLRTLTRQNYGEAVRKVKRHLAEDPNGSDFKCTICVVVFTIVRNEIGDNRKEIEKFLGKACNMLPVKYNATCNFVVTVFGDQIIQALLNKEMPSKICNDLKVFHCNGCTLNNVGTNSVNEEQAVRSTFFAHLLAFHLSKRDSNSVNWGKQLGDDIRPLIDRDKDLFSPTHASYRGADWRGRDCDDSNPHVKPGISSKWETDPKVDTNCNGIFGRNDDGRLYEDALCSNSFARTVVMFGDSASSGFHIPPEWLHLQNISNLFHTLDDEFDWPHYSWSTGFDPEINGNSVLMKLRKRNLCNHRDFQNVGHNGAKMRDLSGYQLQYLSVDKNTSKPMLAFVAYIGNDVCKDQLSQMTTVKQFEAQLRTGLEELDKRAPSNSKVLILGLVDGRILWNEMHNQIHPLGSTYQQLYNFLTCTSANPCKTWLNSNETMRDATSARAAELSQVAQRVVRESVGKYSNLELDYLEFPLAQAVEQCKREGLSPSLLIEAFDGFHPSHFGHRLFAQIIWDFLENKHPDWLGPVNPFNAKISEVFGDQGGF